MAIKSFFLTLVKEPFWFCKKLHPTDRTSEMILFSFWCAFDRPWGIVFRSALVQFEAQGIYRDEICAHLYVGSNQVSRILGFFRDNSTLACVLAPGQPKKVAPEVLDFIDRCTLQSARLSIVDLSSEVRS
jgi:hypothetical protein